LGTQPAAPAKAPYPTTPPPPNPLPPLTQPLPSLDEWQYAGATVLRGQEAEIWTLRERLSGAKTAVYNFYITPSGEDLSASAHTAGSQNGIIVPRRGRETVALAGLRSPNAPTRTPTPTSTPTRPPTRNPQAPPCGST
jgi:hypothetical protein